ncbi:GM12538 [Drosophila sechellia]|uniref:GM12538 n=1 Tax=Drosophila sechellia TaxID=7238 RepID=B4I040_DROSE|nr:GM12538 [Drosophila sechellia]
MRRWCARKSSSVCRMSAEKNRVDEETAESRSRIVDLQYQTGLLCKPVSTA